MTTMGTKRTRIPTRAAVVAVAMALLASACAGDVGRYRNGLPGEQVAAGAPAAASGAESAPPAQGGDNATPGTDAPVAADTTGPAPAPGAVTPSSGPAAAGARARAVGGRNSAGSPGAPGAAPTGAGSPSGAQAGSAQAGSAPTGSTQPGRGSAPTGQSGAGPAPSPGGGGPAPGTPAAPAPVPGGGTTTGVTKDTITVGLFYPKTGAYTGLGRNGPAVAQAAFDEAGPVNGRRLVLKTYDDGTANASTIQVEEKRAKDEAFALMSLVGESNVVLAPLANQHKLPVIVGNIDEKVALPLTYSFPVYAYWARQAKILPGFIKNVLGGGGKKIGIVYEGTSTATDAKNAFKDKARELGLNVVFEQPIAQNQSTCANEVSNLQAHGVELVYMMNGPLGGICMLRDARALGFKPIWTGVGSSWSFNVVAEASGGGADGIRTLSTTTTLDTPAGRHFSEVMRKYAPNSGADSDDIMLIFYALMQTAIEGLRRAGPDLTREGFVQTMETKMNGYDSGYLPPPVFGPGNRSGPVTVGVSACCTSGRWTTPITGWRADF